MEDQKHKNSNPNLKNPFSHQQEQPAPEKAQSFVNPFMALAKEKKESAVVYSQNRGPVANTSVSHTPVSNTSERTINQSPMSNPYNSTGASPISQPNENKSSISQSTENDKESSATNRFENLGFNKWELVQGEELVTSIKCKIMLLQYPSVIADGIFVVSTYRLMFKPEDPSFFKKYGLKSDYLKLPLGFLLKLERTYDKRSLDIAYLDIYSKDGRILRLRISETTQRESGAIIQYLSIYAFPEKKEHFFAFEFNKVNRALEDKFGGWGLYDIEKEFKRQGATFAAISGGESESNPNNLFRIIDNRYFRLCSTYPQLLLVPSQVTDKILIASSKFRSRERLPVVTYYYKKKGTILSRSSQSKPGIYQNRCIEDELMLRYLGDPSYDETKDYGTPDIDLSIYDARPYLNAMAQKVNGKGFEDTKLYRNCEIHFMDIDNIHHVRDSHKKVLNLCHSPDPSNNKWYSQLDGTGWLEVISYIISASAKVALSLQRGRNCLVHCSDGWDRTAQILSLAQIMLDPYFRTIEGFEVLVMKEWISFGHQCFVRMAHGNKNASDDQRSPIFLQFLDCVHQILHQYPFAFEFNEHFLLDLAYHAYSCLFGTFLCNSAQEVIIYQLESRTVSIWSYLNSQKEKYLNAYYDTMSDKSSLIIRPNHHMKHLRLWEEYFLYYSWLSKPSFSLSDKIIFANDFGEYMYAKEKKVASSLRAEVEKLRKILQQNNIKEEDFIEEKGAEEEKPSEEIEVINMEGEPDQVMEKEQKEEEDIALREKQGHLEYIERAHGGEKVAELDSEQTQEIVTGEDESQKLVEKGNDDKNKTDDD